MTTWHESDEFWETFGPAMFTSSDMAAAGRDIDDLLALTQIPSGAAVLDLCCGPGRHCLELAPRGFRATGVDRTAAYLERAGAAARDENLEVNFVQADARTFARPLSFDLAINLCTSFGYFDDPADDRKVAQTLFESLRHGGMLVVELSGKEVVARTYQRRIWGEEDGLLMLQESTICDDWTRVEKRWIIIREGELHEARTSIRLYSAAELKALLQSVGFSETRAFGSLAGDPYDEAARRLVVVAVR
jgi:SAM-dependent methyltransferase